MRDKGRYTPIQGQRLKHPMEHEVGFLGDLEPEDFSEDVQYGPGKRREVEPPPSHPIPDYVDPQDVARHPRPDESPQEEA